jgi:hypothetical protein
MADQFSKLYDVERVGGDQRTRLAELLRSQGMNTPQGQMVSGWYVKPSWTQNLNSALQMGLGTYMGAQLDEERKQKTADILRQLSQGKEVEPIPAVQNFNGMERMAEGQTPMPQQAPQNELERLTRKPQMPVEQSQMNPAMAPRQEQRFVPLTEEEKIGKVMELAQYNPYAAQIWSTQDAARQARLAKLEDVASQRQFTAEQNQLNRQSREDMIRLGAMLRPAPAERMLTVMDESGTPFTIPQSQMQPGMVLYTPATAKAFQEKQGKTKGQTGVSDTLDVLKTQYDVLNAENAIPSTQNRWGTNLGAKIATTGAGQWLGQVAGTKAQEARDLISQTRPLLLADIKKATGMTASEMNSNAELQMWLSVATDPTKGYEANMEALKNLENKFGLGRSAKPSSSNW